MEWLTVIGILIGLAILTIFVGVARTLEPSATDRLGEFLNDRPGQAQSISGSAAIGSGASTLVQSMDRTIRSISLGDRLASALLRADLQTNVTEYLIIWLFMVLGIGLLGYLLGSSWLFGLLGAVIGALLPYFFLRSRQAGRIRNFNGQLHNVLMQLSGSMRAGYGLQQAIDFVAHEMPAPAGKEFTQVIRDVKLGRTMMQALDDLIDRVRSDDLQMIVTAIHIHHETGGNLSEILETVSETIRERVRIKGELQALTGTQRLAGYVLGALPVIVFLILMLLNPTYESNLFAPGITLCIPVCALISMVLGYVTIQKLIQLDV
jgi:tight adherence protein B